MNRLPTGVEGLDEILNGGLFEGGVYILEGPPGVGKTTLANQVAYTLARRDAKTLYVTMLAESHARMLQHMEHQSFFDQSEVNSRVFYVSGYRELVQGGLRSVVELLRGEITRSRAALLVIDGLVIEGQESNADDSVRQFVHELQSLVNVLSCTCLILTSGRANALSADQTMVDGLLAFEDHGFHWRAERRMQVRKFRGCQVIRGQHTFCISSRGLQFFPRLESLPPPTPHKVYGEDTAPSGLAMIDSVLHRGGLFAGGASVVIGHSGSGKTTMALAFAAASTASHPGLFISCSELPADLRNVATALGLQVEEAIGANALTISHMGLEDESMDEMGHKLLRLVDEGRVRRLVVDGLEGLADTLAFSERGYRFLGRLLLELKHRGVTSIFTVDPDALAVAAGTALAEGVVGWFDNAFVFEGSAESRKDVGARPLQMRKVRGNRGGLGVVDVNLALLKETVPDKA